MRRDKSKNRRRCASVVVKATAYSFATGAGVYCAGSASAAPVQYTPPGAPIEIAPGDSFLIDLDSSGSIDLYLFNDSGGNATAGTYGSTLFDPALGLGSNAEAHEAGEQIGTATTGWTSTVSLVEFLSNRAYLGISYLGGDSQEHFAYLDIAVDDTIVLYGGAYEALANTAITTAIPEPGGLTLLALGAAGLATRRRNRKSTD